jgi:NAD(P)-dependent dehydrogenase (short-subunit alcohol dehydrogenase family)
MKAPARVALVTGAAGGIGRAVVRALAKDHRVVATDRERPRRVPGADAALALDVTREEQARAARDAIQRRYRRLDVLVHCAAIALPGALLAARPADWERTFQVNVLGTVRCVRVFGELMVRRAGGWMILLGSLAARVAVPGLGAYAASKAALESVTRTAAAELAASRVGVVALLPGWVDTPMLRSRQRIPRGHRIAHPEDVAELVAALARSRTRLLSGSCISAALTS